MLKLKANFSSMYGNNLECSICKEVGTLESESHLLNCSVLREKTGVADEMKQVKYEDVFSDVKKQQKVVRVFLKIMNTFEKLKAKNQNDDEI